MQNKFKSYLLWALFFSNWQTVTVRGQEFFRGFFLQARDAETNEWIGSWQDSTNTKTIPECASITHADPRDKEGANLIWNAPQHKSGRVYFTYVIRQYFLFYSLLLPCSCWCTVVNSSFDVMSVFIRVGEFVGSKKSRCRLFCRP